MLALSNNPYYYNNSMDDFGTIDPAALNTPGGTCISVQELKTTSRVSTNRTDHRFSPSPTPPSSQFDLHHPTSTTIVISLPCLSHFCRHRSLCFSFTAAYVFTRIKGSC